MLRPVVIATTLGLATHAVADTVTDPLWFHLGVGAGIGLTHNDYQQQADNAGLPVTFGDPNDTRFAWRAGLGFDIWETEGIPLTLAVQVDWVDLGPVGLDYRSDTQQHQLDDLYDGIASIHPESGYGLAPAVSVHWQGFRSDGLQPLSLGVLTGPLFWQQDYELTDANGKVVRTDRSEGTGLQLGVTADYRIFSQGSLRAGWTLFRPDTEWTQTLMLGAVYRPAGLFPTREKVLPEPAPQPLPAPLPTGVTDHYEIEQGGQRTLDVLANDETVNPQRLQLTWVEGSQAGQLQITDDRQAAVYRHDGSDPASDGFRYWFNDGETEIGPVDVALNIMRTRPEPRSDRFTVTAGIVARLDVVGNDSDPNNSSLFISRINAPDNGWLELINGTLVYLVEEGSGVTETRFEYWVSNGQLEAGPVQVELIVD